MRNTSSNPALTRIPAFAQANKTVGFNARPQTADPIEQAYYGPTATSRDTGRMTVEDVTVRTGIMLAVILATGGLTWFLDLEALAFPAAIIALVIGLVISFKQVTNPAAILAYAAFEGVFLGGISKLFEGYYEGIVVQAIVGTLGVAAAMLLMYRSGKIRVTPKFTKMVIGATAGYAVLLLVNLVASFFTSGGLGLFNGGLFSIGISAFAIGLASLNLVLDFDFIQKGAEAGLPERYGWLAAFGLVVTLVWLYVEILRLLSYLRER
ncbi:MAG: Bax inhibitor-1/YccA family protein [Actinobacteria bacterium]|nr:Bax inhibitor-1/YccA family protein [Actinomycetota bacterium]MCA1720947.1 Bax inhibitor-1/YccA family protein [Actinomycetota bacterium]